jgi:LPXTG-motif cell wall-anchored protein
MIKILKIIIFAVSISHLANATSFSNSYISFDLPPNWDCTLEGTEYVCVSKYAKDAKEAIIIFTAKEVGPVDSMLNYKTHLNAPRSLLDKTGNMVPSKVLNVSDRMIANHPWIDSLHLGSEITSYYTRYLATIKERLAILITFSAHKDSYTKYSNDFLKAVESLRVVASKDILDSKPTTSNNDGGTFGPSASLDPISPVGELPPEPTSGGDLMSKLLGLALLIGAIGFYLWRKKKK